VGENDEKLDLINTLDENMVLLPLFPSFLPWSQFLFIFLITAPRGIGRQGSTKMETQEISIRRRSRFFLRMKVFVIDGGTYPRAGTTRGCTAGEERRHWNGCTRRKGLPGKFTWKGNRKRNNPNEHLMAQNWLTHIANIRCPKHVYE
jgi:hypothetical protein